MIKTPTTTLEKILDIFIPYIFPIIGTLCLIEPHGMMKFAPALIGGLMIIAGVFSHIEAIHHRIFKDLDNGEMANSLVLVIIGIIIVLNRDTYSITLMGYAWGFVGLNKGAKYIDKSINYALKKRPFLLMLSWGLLNAGLGIWLIIDPAENFEHHVFLLGFELILYSIQSLSLTHYLTDKYEHSHEENKLKSNKDNNIQS